MNRMGVAATAFIASLAVSGGAFAQGVAPTRPAQPAPAEKIEKAPIGSGEMHRESMGDSMRGSMPGSDAAGKPAAGSHAKLSEDLVGKDVVNSAGEEIGEIERIEGDHAIVSVGGFLGIGAREVSIPAERLMVTGTGDDAKVSTTLTRDQVAAMPEHGAAPAGTGRTR